VSQGQLGERLHSETARVGKGDAFAIIEGARVLTHNGPADELTRVIASGESGGRVAACTERRVLTHNGPAELTRVIKSAKAAEAAAEATKTVEAAWPDGSGDAAKLIGDLIAHPDIDVQVCALGRLCRSARGARARVCVSRAFS